MAAMTERGDRRGAAGRLLLPLLGTLVSTAGWAVLVLVAVEFGGRGRDGDAVAWVFLGVAGVAGAGCLVLALFFGRQLLVAAGLISDYQPKRARR